MDAFKGKSEENAICRLGEGKKASARHKDMRCK